MRKTEYRHTLWLLCFMGVCELFYLLIVALSPLPGLHLSDTPLITVWSWTLVPFQLLMTTLTPLFRTLLLHVSFSLLLLGTAFLGLMTIYAGAIMTLARLRHGIHQKPGLHWLFLLLAGALLFGLTLLLQPKLFSDDVFTYIFSGRLLVVYGANPLSTTPSQHPADPYLTWVLSGRNAPNIYGPLWIAVAALLAHISNIPVVTLLIFKGFALLTHLLNCVLIWAILDEIAPTRIVLGTLLYAWNPLAVIELAGSGHNEGFLLVLLLLATLLYTHYIRKKTRWLLVGMLFIMGLAVCTNLLTLLVAPLYMWFDVRTERSIGRAIWGFSWRMFAIIIPEMLISLPFWHGASTFFAITSAVDMQHFVHSPVGTLAIPIRALFQYIATIEHFPAFLQPIAAADVTLRASALFIFVLIYTNLFGQLRHAPGSVAVPLRRYRTTIDPELSGFDVLFGGCSIAIFWYLVLVSGWFWPWYVLWVLWPVMLRHPNAFTIAILVLSCTALFLYPFVGFTRGPIATYQAAIIFGIPLVYLVSARIRLGLVERTV